MNEKKAALFLNDLFENVLPRGQVSRLAEFYTKDVIGHQNNQLFYLADIKKRVEVLGQQLATFRFKVESFLLIDNLIVFVVRQNWVDKKSALHEALITGTYRIRNNKICELWLLTDSPVDNYQKVNENFSLGMKPFRTNEKAKKEFFKRLSITHQLHLKKQVPLNAAEQECLYYYLNGFSAKEAAKVLGFSFRTIETYIANLKIKLNCHNKKELRNKLFPAGSLI
jgi:DNA-binding CsgD family transcriptional regulator